MILQDKDAKRWLKIANCNELTESIESFPENERDGLSDMQILADEVSYRLSLYTEGGTSTGEEYEESRKAPSKSAERMSVPTIWKLCEMK